GLDARRSDTAVRPTASGRIQPCIVNGESHKKSGLGMAEATQTTRQARGSSFWIPRIAAAVLGPMMLLVVIEGVFRLAGAGSSTDLTVPCTLQGRAAACYNLFFPAPFFPPGMIKTPQAYAIPAEKPPGNLPDFRVGRIGCDGRSRSGLCVQPLLEVMLR